MAPHTQHSDQHHRALLQSIANQAMIERGLLPTFSEAANSELRAIQASPAAQGASGTQVPEPRDLRDLLWASIDNDDSRDLDQLTVAEARSGDAVAIRVAIADVDALVKEGSAIDAHAAHNTTSVYTAAKIFPMLPEPLSTDLTSLNPDEDRLAVVVEMVVDGDGAVQSSDVYRARVRNRAKLAYKSVAAWLEGQAEPPRALAAVPGLAENLREQDKAAQRLKRLRHERGALSLRTIRARPVFDGDRISQLDVDQKSRATELIEDFMIAANGVTARYLAAKNLPSLRRVVRTPKALGSHRRAGADARALAAERARLGGAGRFPGEGAGTGSRTIPRRVPGRRQAAGRG